MSDPTTLGEALPLEMARVRDEVLPAYVEIGQAGSIAATLMRLTWTTRHRRWPVGTFPP